jgi:hypothetical protein
MSVSDFGSTYTPPIGGVPQRLLSGGGSSSAEISSGVVPLGQTWIILGVDVALTAAATVVMAAEAVLPSPHAFFVATGIVPTGGIGVSASWRGYLPMYVGDILTVLCEGASGEAYCTAWGLVLPYTTF